jgi:hypothetical protein
MPILTNSGETLRDARAPACLSDLPDLVTDLHSRWVDCAFRQLFDLAGLSCSAGFRFRTVEKAKDGGKEEQHREQRPGEGNR